MTLEIKNGTMHANGRLLFNNLNFSVSNGEIVCIQGAHGGGKTMLLRALMGLEPLSEGFINIDGELLNPQSAQPFRRLMAYVPQHTQLPAPTMNLLLGELTALRANRDTRAATPNPQRQETLMQLMGLPPALADKPVAELNAGQAYRMMVVVAAMMNKQILLIDEPAAPLDSAAAQRVDNFLHEMASVGTAIVAVSQDQLFADSCNHTVALSVQP